MVSSQHTGRSYVSVLSYIKCPWAAQNYQAARHVRPSLDVISPQRRVLRPLLPMFYAVWAPRDIPTAPVLAGGDNNLSLTNPK